MSYTERKRTTADLKAPCNSSSERMSRLRLACSLGFRPNPRFKKKKQRYRLEKTEEPEAVAPTPEQIFKQLKIFLIDKVATISKK